MATGDRQDMLARIRGMLPPWFGDGGPILTALLTGLAEALAFVYSLYLYVQAQTRIATATDDNLDIIAADFFGNGLIRKLGQSDSSYRSTIYANLLRERATRHAVVKVLQGITGNTPTILEPWRPADFGGYGAAYGYGSGAYGFSNASALTYQAFIQIQRQINPGGPAGYGSAMAGYGAGAASYNPCNLQYDANIYAAVEAVRPIGTVDWVAITG